MNVNELRIGNYINTIGAPSCCQFQVKSILNESSINHDIESNKEGICSISAISLSTCEGIPLTHSVLQKCGFKRDKMGHWRKNMGRSKFFVLRGKCYDYISHSYFDTLCVMHYEKMKVNFLHQLQNIFFELTGKELEYK